MTPTIRKQFITLVQEQGAVKQALDVLEILFVMMKKFGKQLSQSPIKEFVQKNYPDAYGLYELLGGVHFTIKDCLVLQQHLYESLGDDALIALTSDDHALDDIQVDGELVVIDGGDETNPSLTIKSPSKIYKRSLSADLQKLL